MTQIYSLQESKQWDELVCSFSNYDVYYLSGYVKAFELHGDGTSQLFYYNHGGLRAIYVYMKRPTIIDHIYDAITPYGYGGFIMDGNLSAKNIEDLIDTFHHKMREECIIDNFVRYHPVINNAQHLRAHSQIIDLGKTVSIDLSSEETIWENIHSKNRNMIRKAIKNGVVIKHGKGIQILNEFMSIYNSTMDSDNANSYYYFGNDFYHCIQTELHDNYEVFWAEYNGRIISISIILFANERLNYHLSGSLKDYRNLAPSNLLLYEVACWGAQRGFKTFHLGGGLGSSEDSLYKFKKSFNKNADCQFSIGKEIIDLDKYNLLVDKRKEVDKDFDINSNFFPLYRL